jgi:hypothetical protein
MSITSCAKHGAVALAAMFTITFAALGQSVDGTWDATVVGLAACDRRITNG